MEESTVNILTMNVRWETLDVTDKESGVVVVLGVYSQIVQANEEEIYFSDKVYDFCQLNIKTGVVESMQNMEY